MSVLRTVKSFVQSASSAPNRDGGKGDGSKGAYWCHDCRERIRDVDVTGAGPPDCPTCGEEMTFERSAASTGCAC